MTVRATAPDRIDGSDGFGVDNRLHKPGVAGSSPAAAIRINDSVTIDHDPAEIYHRRPGVSASQLKELAYSPLAFYLRYEVGEAPPKSSGSLEYGTLLHLWAELGDELFWSRVVTPPQEVLTATGQMGKAAQGWLAEQSADAIVVSPADRKKLWDQTRQILACAPAKELLDESVDREFNVSFRWQGHDCRCRVDGATPGVFFDWKTTREADPLKTAWRAVQDFNYDIQSALYGEAAVQCGWPAHRMRFVFTSTVWPYMCCVVVLPEEVQERGRRRCLALLDELKRRREWGTWLPNGYGEVVELSCPAWMKGVDA